MCVLLVMGMNHITALLGLIMNTKGVVGGYAKKAPKNYTPHQGEQEKARRRRQMAAGHQLAKRDPRLQQPQL